MIREEADLGRGAWEDCMRSLSFFSSFVEMIFVEEFMLELYRWLWSMKGAVVVSL